MGAVNAYEVDRTHSVSRPYSMPPQNAIITSYVIHAVMIRQDTAGSTYKFMIRPEVAKMLNFSRLENYILSQHTTYGDKCIYERRDRYRLRAACVVVHVLTVGLLRPWTSSEWKNINIFYLQWRQMHLWNKKQVPQKILKLLIRQRQLLNSARIQA